MTFNPYFIVNQDFPKGTSVLRNELDNIFKTVSCDLASIDFSLHETDNDSIFERKADPNVSPLISDSEDKDQLFAELNNYVQNFTKKTSVPSNAKLRRIKCLEKFRPKKPNSTSYVSLGINTEEENWINNEINHNIDSHNLIKTKKVFLKEPLEKLDRNYADNPQLNNEVGKKNNKGSYTHALNNTEKVIDNISFPKANNKVNSPDIFKSNSSNSPLGNNNKCKHIEPDSHSSMTDKVINDVDTPNAYNKMQGTDKCKIKDSKVPLGDAGSKTELYHSAATRGNINCTNKLKNKIECNNKLNAQRVNNVNQFLDKKDVKNPDVKLLKSKSLGTDTKVDAPNKDLGSKYKPAYGDLAENINAQTGKKDALRKTAMLTKESNSERLNTYVHNPEELSLMEKLIEFSKQDYPCLKNYMIKSKTNSQKFNTKISPKNSNTTHVESSNITQNSKSTNKGSNKTQFFDSTNKGSNTTQTFDSTNMGSNKTQVFDSTNKGSNKTQTFDSTNEGFNKSQTFDSTNMGLNITQTFDSINKDSNRTQTFDSTNKGSNVTQEFNSTNKGSNTTQAFEETNKGLNCLPHDFESNIKGSNINQDINSTNKGSFSTFGANENFQSSSSASSSESDEDATLETSRDIWFRKRREMRAANNDTRTD